MANSKQFLFDDKEHRRLKTGINITSTLDSEENVIIDLPRHITSNAATATLAEKVQFQNSTSKSYLLGSLSTISGQKPMINSSVYMSGGNLYATGFYGNGAGLTNLTPSNISSGTANINITGTAEKVGFTIDSSRKTYLLGTITTVDNSSITGEIKPTYSSYIYMQNNTLYAGYFSGDGRYLKNVASTSCTGNSNTADKLKISGVYRSATFSNGVLSFD